MILHQQLVLFVIVSIVWVITEADPKVNSEKSITTAPIKKEQYKAALEYVHKNVSVVHMN